MKARDIKLAARRNLDGAGIVILEGPAASPEHRMVAQYEEVIKLFDQLDHSTFEIGRAFLQDLSAQYPDNITLKCLILINSAAFNEPSPEHCDYLLQHGPAQIQYGLNVYPIIKDGWQCARKTEDEIKALQQKHWPALAITPADLATLRDKFKIAGVHASDIEPQVKEFMTMCSHRRIAVAAMQP